MLNAVVPQPAPFSPPVLPTNIKNGSSDEEINVAEDAWIFQNEQPLPPQYFQSLISGMTRSKKGQFMNGSFCDSCKLKLVLVMCIFSNENSLSRMSIKN